MAANQLIHETSPYLLQHAHNPVSWRPWGTDAIELARREDKLIFLSIGYSTCYWCHVMERESFEDEATARLMNERVVSVKVDREERPDLDEIYMTATQLLTGRGGWPMSVWLDPRSLRPIYAGTYFPPEPSHGMPSFEQVITAIDDAWRRDRAALVRNSERLAEAVRETVAKQRAPVAVGAREISHAVNALMRTYDSEHGGFGGAPKFPQPVYLELLLAAREFLDEEPRIDVDRALRHTLERMAMGGVYDQIGGGFHRYSTDERWLVPHFEKMLYDNAQLAPTYARASILYGDQYFAQIARETLDYVLREMADSDGGFYSAQDAEVNAREGLNYLWTADDVRSALESAGRSDLSGIVARSFGLEHGTNFRDPHHPEDPPSNVLFLIDRPETLAQQFGKPLEEFNRNLAEVKGILLAHRARRPQPATDDKVIAAWNGLMIAALADTGRILAAPRYVEAGARAASFVLDAMRDGSGGLLRTWRKGRGGIHAFAEDYAMVMRGLLALDAAQPENERWRSAAAEMVDRTRERFGDPSGGWFDTWEGRPDLFVRAKSMHDGAVPSATGVMLHNLLDLFKRVGDPRFLNEAAKALASVSPSLREQPLGATLSTLALMRFVVAYPDRLPCGAPPVESGADGVAMSVDREEIRFHAGEGDPLTITIDIPQGMHINAHAPGDPALVGLAVHVADGDGVIATAAYPRGEPWNEVEVHTGTIEIQVTLKRVAPVTGDPKLAVRWQACSERECLPPTERILPVRLVVEDD